MLTSQESGTKATRKKRAWITVGVQTVQGKRCNILIRVTGSSTAYKWMYVETGAEIQRLIVPSRQKEVRKVWLEGEETCSHWVYNRNNYKLCLNEFVPCTPHFSRKLVFDRIFWLNDKEAYLYDNDEYENNGRDYVTVAQLYVR